MSDIHKKLSAVQHGLKAPKSQHNKFGNYNYRSCEDILEALKPILSATGAYVNISDEIVLVGDRYYVKATASFCVDGETISANAYAREAEIKKGMDDAQITGSASSYARKYALNGLFAIDDTKDADATNEHGNGEQQATKYPGPPKNPRPSQKDVVISSIEKCATIDELVSIWESLTPERRKKYNAVKERKKADLTHTGEG